MKTRVLPANADSVAEAAAVLRRGGLVAFPTETVYGLGANALNAEAVAGIFAAKGRPSHNPLIVHVADLAAAVELAGAWPPAAQRLAEHFWPGPLTLVVPTSPSIPGLVTAGGSTVALRVPAHLTALALLRAAGLPLAAPSANRSSALSPTLAEHVLAGLDGRIDLLLDAGPTPGGIESTVLDVTASLPRLLRPGLIAPSQIEAVVGPIVQGKAGGNPGVLRSPGQLARHYAPRTPLEIAHGNGTERVQQLRASGLRVGWLACRAMEEQTADGMTILMPADPAAYAAQLYTALHTLDHAGLDRIVVSMPGTGELWLGIEDRLRRASASA